MQIQNSAEEVLHLDSCFAPTAGFFVWRSFDRAALVPNGAVPEVWRLITMRFVQLPDMAILGERQLQQLTGMTSFLPSPVIAKAPDSSDPNPPDPDLSSSPLAVQKLLHLMQLLLLSADKVTTQSSARGGGTVDALQQAVILHELMPISDQQPQACTDLHDPVQRLHAMLMLLKLITLASAVSNTRHRQRTSDFLWAALCSISRHYTSNTQKAPAHMTIEMGRIHAKAKLVMSQKLASMLVPIIRQDLQAEGHHTDTCFAMLIAISAEPDAAG